MGQPHDTALRRPAPHDDHHGAAPRPSEAGVEAGPQAGTEAGRRADEAAAAEVGTLRVLLVEDNAGDARLLREYLSESETVRFEIETVARLSEAMDKARGGGYSIVLLDLSLPDGSGLDSFTTLAREVPHVPIVVLTGLDDHVLALRAVQAGAQDYLVKGQVNETTLPRSLLYAVERHRVQRELQALSIVDELTGLYNRRGFLSMAGQHLRAAARENRALALFYADLDGLKQINDRFGHREGDWALAQAAQVLRASFRESDVLARLGGDEFTVLAWMRSAEDVEHVIERAREHAVALNERAGRPFSLRMSIGAAFVPPGEIFSVEELLARADAALYEAKRNKPRSVLPGG